MIQAYSKRQTLGTLQFSTYTSNIIRPAIAVTLYYTENSFGADSVIYLACHHRLAALLVWRY